MKALIPFLNIYDHKYLRALWQIGSFLDLQTIKSVKMSQKKPILFWEKLILFCPVLSCQKSKWIFLLAEEGRRRLNYQIGLEWRLIDRSNPLEYLTPEEVKRVYRFHPDTITFLLGIVLDVLLKPFSSERGLPLPPVINLLCTLVFTCYWRISAYSWCSKLNFQDISFQVHWESLQDHLQ